MVESAHAGALAIARVDGSMLLSVGETDRLIYPRSTIKAIQSVPLVASGAADMFGLDTRELAIACASHGGTDDHVAAASHLLRRAGIKESALACGPHWPLDTGAQRALACDGGSPRPIHNNCSGKHAGMLAVARHLGLRTEGYERPEHPVQLAIKALIERLSGYRIPDENEGTDGCSVPTWAMPLSSLARMFACFVSGEGLSEGEAQAARRLCRACADEPAMVAGPGRFCTEALTRMGGRVFIKGGAEGVYCAGFPELGLGVALKIDDGARRGSEVVMGAVLKALFPCERNTIDAFTDGAIRNWHGDIVGALRPAAPFLDALKGLVD